MRLHRFFSPEKISENNVEKIGSGSQNDTSDLITQKLATDQWRRVFRFGPGDKVILFDGSGKDFVCEIQSYEGEKGKGIESALLKIIEIRENNVKPVRNVSLYAAVVKKDTFEWITEKATELGVSDITPVIAERSEKKNLNQEDLEKIAVEASEQSGRGTVPRIHSVIDPKFAIGEVLKRKQPAVVFDPSGVKFSESFPNNFSDSATDPIAVFIGPEGGWSSDELKSFEKAAIPILSLGLQILRAETAVVAALSRLVF